MKNIKPKIRHTFLVVLIIVGYAGYIASCTNDDQLIEPTQVVNSGTDLLSIPVDNAPTIDGTIESIWEDSPILEFSTAVPEVTGDVFRGYAGNIIPSVKLRSVYDDEYIYFLAEWADPTQSFERNPWYFNPTTKKVGTGKGLI